MLAWEDHGARPSDQSLEFQKDTPSLGVLLGTMSLEISFPPKIAGKIRLACFPSTLQGLSPLGETRNGLIKRSHLCFTSTRQKITKPKQKMTSVGMDGEKTKHLYSCTCWWKCITVHQHKKQFDSASKVAHRSPSDPRILFFF